MKLQNSPVDLMRLVLVDNQQISMRNENQNNLPIQDKVDQLSNMENHNLEKSTAAKQHADFT